MVVLGGGAQMGHLDARRLGVDDEPDGLRGLLVEGEDDDVVGGVGVLDEVLHAVEHDVAVLALHGDGGLLPAVADVELSRLDDGRRQQPVALGHRGEIPRLLFVAARFEDDHPAEKDGCDVGQRSDGVADLLNDEVRVEERKPLAAVLLREGEAEPAQAGSLAPEIGRVAALVVLHGAGQVERRFAAEKVAGLLAEHAFVFVEGDVHAVFALLARARQRGSPSPRTASWSFWISRVPAAMVEEMPSRQEDSTSPSYGAGPGPSPAMRP